MLFRFSCSTALVAAVALLADGCGAPLSPRTVSQPRATAAAEGSRQRSPRDQAAEEAVVEAHARYAAGVIRDVQGAPELALDDYCEAALHDPGNETLVLEVFRRCLQARQPEKALKLLERATALPDASGTVYACLGFVYSQLGETNLGVKANRIAIEKDPRSLAGYQNLYLLYLEQKQVRKAMDVLKEAGKVRGTDAGFLIRLAAFYTELGSRNPDQKQEAYARASELLQRAEKFNLTDLETRLRLADGYHLLGDDARAVPIYRELLDSLSDAPFVRERIRAKLVDIYFRSGDRQQAAELLRSIIRDNPTDAKAYYFLGSIAYADTNYPTAAECFGKTVLLDPDFEPAYYDLAGAQMAAKQAGDALATLEAARKKFPQTFLLEYLSALVNSQQKDYSNAVSHFTAAEIVAQVTDPKRLTDVFYFQFGAACERVGDYAQAEKHFEKCLELSPDFAEALNYLGYMWAERGQRLDRARDLIARALKVEPKNPAYLDSMAWVLFKLNQPQQALDYELQAVANSEMADAEISNHLGDIYAALGQHDKAREAWRQSLSLEPNDQVRKKLESSAR